MSFVDTLVKNRFQQMERWRWLWLRGRWWHGLRFGKIVHIYI